MNKMTAVKIAIILSSAVASVAMAALHPDYGNDIQAVQSQTLTNAMSSPIILGGEAITRSQLLLLTSTPGNCSPGEMTAYVTDNNGFVIETLCWIADTNEAGIDLSDGHRQALDYFRWSKAGYIHLAKVYKRQVDEYKRVNGIK